MLDTHVVGWGTPKPGVRRVGPANKVSVTLVGVSMTLLVDIISHTHIHKAYVQLVPQTPLAPFCQRIAPLAVLYTTKFPVLVTFKLTPLSTIPSPLDIFSKYN